MNAESLFLAGLLESRVELGFCREQGGQERIEDSLRKANGELCFAKSMTFWNACKLG